MISRSESTNFSDLSPELIHNFKQLFKFIDIDNDNSINKDDIERLIKVMNLTDSIDLNTMFAKDADSITYPEFLSIMGKLFQGFPGYDKLRDALLSFSQEKDNKSLENVDLDILFDYLTKTGFYIKEKDVFISKWRHYINVENGTTYFKGEKFLQNFG